MKIKKIVIVALTAISVAGTGIATTVDTPSVAYAKSSKWHKGTPKTLRGNYQTKHYGADLMMVCKIHAKSFYFWGSGMPAQNGYNVHYKYLGHKKYVIRYDAHKSGMFKGGKKLEMYVVKTGKNVKVNGYKILFRKY